MMLLKKFVMCIVCFFVILPALASEQESLFGPNQVHGKITALKLTKRLIPDQKVEELAKFFLEAFEKKVLPKWKDDRWKNQNDFSSSSIDNFVYRILISRSTFKMKGDVQLPFKTNITLKNQLTKELLNFVNKSQEKAFITFEKEVKNAQSQLTENWLKVHSEKVNLEKEIVSQYIDKYLKDYGCRPSYWNSEDTGSDGYLIKKQLEIIESRNHVPSQHLAIERPFFPIAVTIDFNAEEMIEALGKSVYAQGNSPILTKDDFSQLDKKQNEIEKILTALINTGYPPEGAEIILKEWNRIMGDQWISNKLLIAKHVLGKEIK